MSGGVDSSVAAALLLEAGHDVTGVTLKLWGGESDSGCCSVADVEDARRVAAQLGHPALRLQLHRRVRRRGRRALRRRPCGGSHAEPVRRVQPVDQVRSAARAGRRCSASTSWPPATTRGGRRPPAGRYSLRRGADAAKDQSYVLYMLGQRELARTRFPVGELTKADVRAHAASSGCAPPRRPRAWTSASSPVVVAKRSSPARVPARAGAIVDTSGVTLGEHDGTTAFTVGQRRGLGVATGERALRRRRRRRHRDGHDR